MVGYSREGKALIYSRHGNAKYHLIVPHNIITFTNRPMFARLSTLMMKGALDAKITKNTIDCYVFQLHPLSQNLKNQSINQESENNTKIFDLRTHQERP